MRIIDKKHDFYDYLQCPTDTIIFDRRDSFVLTKEMICSTMKEKKKIYRGYDVNYNHRLIIMQCGAVYWMFLLTITDRITVEEYDIPINYDIDFLISWKNYNKPRKIIDFYIDQLSKRIYHKGKLYEYTKDRILEDAEHLKRHFEQSNYYISICEGRIPIINATGIGNLVNPLDVFCAIEEYFSMEKTASETTEAKGTTNDDKIIMHGFDTKISFRGKQ